MLISFTWKKKKDLMLNDNPPKTSKRLRSRIATRIKSDQTLLSTNWHKINVMFRTGRPKTIHPPGARPRLGQFKAYPPPPSPGIEPMSVRYSGHMLQ